MIHVMSGELYIFQILLKSTVEKHLLQFIYRFQYGATMDQT